MPGMSTHGWLAGARTSYDGVAESYAGWMAGRSSQRPARRPAQSQSTISAAPPPPIARITQRGNSRDTGGGAQSIGR